MNVIEKARELGALIQQDERYLKYQEACSATDTDVEVQNAIGRFNQLRQELSVEMQKEDKDADRMTSLDSEIKELYQQIMEMPNMVKFNEAKADLDKLLSSVNYILTSSANGEDPATCPAEPPHSCGGNCGSCGGCH